MKRINPNVVPSDGYKFKDTDGVEISGKNWVDLLSNVISYRKQNKVSTKGTSLEILAYACARHPQLCSETSQQVDLPGAHKLNPLKSRVIQWLLRTPKRPKDHVTKPEVEARRQICRSCPMNKPFVGASECRSCNHALGNLQERIFGSYRQSPGVFGCDVYGVDLTIATWLQKPQVMNGEIEGVAPPACWVISGS